MIKLKSLDRHPEVHSGLLESKNADTRIVVKPFAHSVSYFLKDTRLFNTNNALLLFEEGCEPVLYVPKSDIFKRHFLPSTKTTYCPYKGQASYWSLSVADEIIIDAVWEYAEPKSNVGIIEDHVAFANYTEHGAYLIYDT